MSDPKERWSDNDLSVVEINDKKVSFFCDSDCILCSLCSELAPKNFKISGMEDHDICFKQPENQEELEQCNNAMVNCPVSAIGDNGYEAGDDEGVKAIPRGQRFAPSYYDDAGKKKKKTFKEKLKEWFLVND